MLNKSNTARKMMVVVAMMVLLTVPQMSYAYWGVGIDLGAGAPRYNYFYHYNEHPQWGWHIHYLPQEQMVVRLHGTRYHYYDGLYYRYVGPGDYELVQPPVGVYVNVIPAVFQPLVINGRTYFTDARYYYILTPRHGYKLVRPPFLHR